LEGPTAATAGPVVPGGERGPRARAIRSTIAIQAPVTQGTPVAIETPIAWGAIAPMAIKTPIAQGGA
ncbi:hypothetical protein N340_06838, partial [Tauraco erythrolophus]